MEGQSTPLLNAVHAHVQRHLKIPLNSLNQTSWSITLMDGEHVGAQSISCFAREQQQAAASSTSITQQNTPLQGLNPAKEAQWQPRDH